MTAISGWRAWLHAWPMSATYSAPGYPETYGTTYPGTAGGVVIPIETGSLAGAETQRPRYTLRAVAGLLDDATMDLLDPTAGTWVDLWVQYDYAAPETHRRARLVLTHAHTTEDATGNVMTDIEAVSVDVLTHGEPIRYHRLPINEGTYLLGWLEWAQQEGYLYNTYDAVSWGTGDDVPGGWAPTRGMTLEQTLDEFVAPRGRVWFGNLDGQLEFRNPPHTTTPHFGIRHLAGPSVPMTSWERRRSWDNWANGALIRHTSPEGGEVTWIVTHGKPDSAPLWRFIDVDSESEGTPDVVAEELARTSARADTVSVGLAAYGTASVDLEVSDTANAHRAGEPDELWIVQDFSLDLASGATRVTLRPDIVRLARFNAGVGMPIGAQDYVTIDDAEQIINGRLVPLEEAA